MGYFSRADLRRMVAEKLGKFAWGYPTSVAGTTLVDASTTERKRDADDYWNGGTLCIVSGVGGPSDELLTESGITETETNGGTVDTSTVDPYDAACWKLSVTATAGSVAKASWTLAVTAGRTVEISFRTKGNGAVSGRWGFYNATAAADIVAAEPTNVAGEKWTRMIRRLVVPAGCSSVKLEFYSSLTLSTTVWFDTPSVRQVGQTRYVSDWANSTGTFTVATWTTNPTIASEYHVFYKDFSLNDYDRAINDALRAAFPYLYELTEDASITTSSGAYSYDIPDTIDPRCIVRVELQVDASTATAPYAEQTFYNIRPQGQTSVLQFWFLPVAGRTVRIVYCRPLQPLDSDFDTRSGTGSVDERYAPYLVARAMAGLYEMQLGKTSRSDRAQVGENRDAFYEEAAFALRQVAMQWPATKVKPQYPGFH